MYSCVCTTVFHYVPAHIPLCSGVAGARTGAMTVSSSFCVVRTTWVSSPIATMLSLCCDQCYFVSTCYWSNGTSNVWFASLVSVLSTVLQYYYSYTMWLIWSGLNSLNDRIKKAQGAATRPEGHNYPAQPVSRVRTRPEPSDVASPKSQWGHQNISDQNLKQHGEFWSSV